MLRAIRRAVVVVLSSDEVRFGSFRLDPRKRLLIGEESTVALRPKTLEVLLLLLSRAGQVVSKQEILATVWADTTVSEYVLTTCISELRTALGEDRKQPRYLKTLHRGGYQFIAAVESTTQTISGADRPTSASTPVVGRENELQQLDGARRRALSGQRQIVFITGEMGIGKTTLADEFLRSSVRGMGPPDDAATGQRTADLVARGQCVEQFGAGEPYMPMLEAIGRLGRELEAPFVVDVLRRHAPAWLIQIPGLLPPEQRAELRRELPAETQEHMLRLIAAAIEALSEQRLLILLLEDLHFSDHATLELVSALALRRGPARLLIIGTFRSAENCIATSTFQSLKQQLMLHRQCEEIVLEPLSRAAVDAYLSKRFAGLALPSGLAATLHSRTEGNPLFVARLVDQLLEDGMLEVDPQAGKLQLAAADIARHVPRDLRALIEQRTDSLAAVEREVLETASVAGMQFWSSTLAAAIGSGREEVERLCSQLSRRHGFLVAGENTDASLPDLGARYVFNHAFYQQVLYERMEVTRRQRLHREIGSALRQSWGGRATEIAGELAFHFERGGDIANAIDFYDKAAVAAAGHAANREAVGYLDRGLALLDGMEDSPTRRSRQLDLLTTRGPAALAAFGYAAVEVLDTYQRALALARQHDDPVRQVSSLLALAIWHQTRANLAIGEQFALELIDVAERIQLPPPFIAQLRNPLSQIRLYQGAVEEALSMADAAVAAIEILPIPTIPLDSRPALWAEPRVLLHCQRAAASFALGRITQAAKAIELALAVAHELQHPFSLAYALCWAALYEDTMGRAEPTIHLARQAIDIAQTYDFPFWEGIGKIFCGHAIAWSDPQRGRAMLHEGIELWRGTGARLANTEHLNLAADASLSANDVGAARSALDEAHTHALQTGEVVFLPETIRLQAECRRRAGAAIDEVEATLRQAIAVSRQHGTKLWELHSTLALHRLLNTAGSRAELTAICSAFDNEPDAREVAEARALLAEQSQPHASPSAPRVGRVPRAVQCDAADHGKNRDDRQ
ncbi:MAG: AAA family ATPase [Deltaproteobacteria bacterium]|nr:AAA family ATPase [Deltaproteobacteria bacterium]